MKLYRYFSEDDFKNALPSCSIDDMSPDLLDMLDKAREIAGIPFKVNSAYRTVEYEKSKGRQGTSRHCFGLAVDIACYTSNFRYRIVSALIEVGFHRIGIGSNFIHADIGYKGSEPIIWLY